MTITPAAIAIVGLLATTGTTIAAQLSADKKARRARSDAQRLLSDQAKKEELLLSRQETLRRRRAAGSGSTGTILGGSEIGQEAEVGKNALLGQ